MTEEVLRAFTEELVSIRLETAVTLDDRDTVIVTCPNGHACRYSQS